MSRILLHKSFGLRSRPWKNVILTTADTQRVADMVDAVVNEQEMVSIIGARGAGKSEAVEQALRAHSEALLVEPIRLTRDKLHMGDIEDALIRDLSNESPKRGGEARSRQVRRVLGTAARNHPVVLMIDDAHVLHHQTKRALKRLREVKWAGRNNLIGILLIAQRDPLHGIEEVQLRSDELWMEGPTRAEASQAIQQAVGHAFAEGAVDALAQTNATKNWLDLQAAAVQCLAQARAAGHAKVTAADVVQATDGGLKALASQLGVKGAEIAKAIGKSESQVSRVINGDRPDPETQDAITDFLLGKQGQSKIQGVA